MRSLPRLVVVLGAISLANDAASEMITPLLPLFLTSVLGAGAAAVGGVEGVAAATASLLQLVAGRLADRGVPARTLMLGGYGVSNAARPAIALATGWPFVLAMRFVDRAGKGLRTAPRDAVLAAAVGAGERGRAFGFQRAMDHTGAMLGPLAAAALLAAHVPLRTVFAISVVPGAAVVALVALGVPRRARAPADAAAPLHWRGLDPRLRALVVAAGAMAFAAIPDAFLVLWASGRGVAVARVPLLWAFAHAGKALVAGPAGRLSDRAGRLRVVVAGWGARVAILLALAALPASEIATWAGFLAYAVALASTEGAERALIGDAAPPAARGTAFGLYDLTVGILALPGGLLFGFAWQRLGSARTLELAATLTAASAGALGLLARRATRAP